MSRKTKRMVCLNGSGHASEKTQRTQNRCFPLLCPSNPQKRAITQTKDGKALNTGYFSLCRLCAQKKPTLGHTQLTLNPKETTLKPAWLVLHNVPLSQPPASNQLCACVLLGGPQSKWRPFSRRCPFQSTKQHKKDTEPKQKKSFRANSPPKQLAAPA